MLTEQPFSASIENPFFKRETASVARDLLGQYLVKNVNGTLCGGRIVETEAYLGLEDPSCHSFHGKKTPRTEVFYASAGTVYVYLIYGMYFCLNFITGDERTPEAVLIRAIEPLWGLEKMRELRKTTSDVSLCNGPGKLCQALDITFSENNKSLVSSSVSLFAAPPVSEQDVHAAERIGLNPQMDCSYWPLRYYIKNNPYVSRP